MVTRELSDVAQALFHLLCRHFFVNLNLLLKASLQEFENGTGKKDLKLSCSAFNRDKLELINSKKKEVCCLCNEVIGLLDTSYLHITCNFWSGIHIYKHYNKREGKRTAANFWFLLLFLVKYFSPLEKDVHRDNTGDYKVFKKSVYLGQAKNSKTRHFSQSYFCQCHSETLRRRCLVVS